MQVAEVMTSKMHTVFSHASFAEILELLVSKHISGVPVVDKRRRLVGIISEKDLLSHLFPTIEEFYHDIHYYWNHQHIESEAGKITKLTAKELMNPRVVTVSPEDHVLRACALLLIHRIRRLPVVRERQLVGIVTTNNLYKNYLKHLLRLHQDTTRT
jgi:CBS domain-containing protein